jgi:hypothetical protein
LHVAAAHRQGIDDLIEGFVVIGTNGFGGQGRGFVEIFPFDLGPLAGPRR